jgi:hypothetical protein
VSAGYDVLLVYAVASVRMSSRIELAPNVGSPATWRRKRLKPSTGVQRNVGWRSTSVPFAGARRVGGADCFWKLSGDATSGLPVDSPPLKSCAGRTAQ